MENTDSQTQTPALTVEQDSSSTSEPEVPTQNDKDNNTQVQITTETLLQNLYVMWTEFICKAFDTLYSAAYQDMPGYAANNDILEINGGKMRVNMKPFFLPLHDSIVEFLQTLKKEDKSLNDNMVEILTRIEVNALSVAKDIWDLYVSSTTKPKEDQVPIDKGGEQGDYSFVHVTSEFYNLMSTFHKDQKQPQKLIVKPSFKHSQSGFVPVLCRVERAEQGSNNPNSSNDKKMIIYMYDKQIPTESVQAHLTAWTALRTDFGNIQIEKHTDESGKIALYAVHSPTVYTPTLFLESATWLKDIKVKGSHVAFLVNRFTFYVTGTLETDTLAYLVDEVFAKTVEQRRFLLSYLPMVRSMGKWVQGLKNIELKEFAPVLQFWEEFRRSQAVLYFCQNALSNHEEAVVPLKLNYTPKDKALFFYIVLKSSLITEKVLHEMFIVRGPLSVIGLFNTEDNTTEWRLVSAQTLDDVLPLTMGGLFWHVTSPQSLLKLFDTLKIKSKAIPASQVSGAVLSCTLPDKYLPALFPK